MRKQRGVALITALAIVVICLAVALVMTLLATMNTKNVGNAYQKQQYYDVAEAGISRGMRDLDSSLPSPGPGFINATPTPPPAPAPGATQTPLPNVAGIGYYYSYWYNANPSPAPTTDPLALAGWPGVPSNHTVNVPSHGAVIWSYTTVGLRDVAVEAVVARISSNPGSCALCAGQSINVQGANACGNCTPPPAWCQPLLSPPDKVCTDPSPSPNPTPSYVPIIMGGTYNHTGNCNNSTCAYGDPTPPAPPGIQQNAPSTVTSSFLAAQGAIDQLANASAWQAAADGVNIKYVDCSSGCSAQTLQNNAPSAGQITYVNGSINLSSGTSKLPLSALQYSGLFIAQCFSLSGNNTVAFQGNGTSAESLALGSDAQFGGSPAAAISVSGNAFWNGGTAYAANGSVYINGTGSTKYIDFYGAIIAAGAVTITGNGNFSWESKLRAQALNFGQYAINSFAQY